VGSLWCPAVPVATKDDKCIGRVLWSGWAGGGPLVADMLGGRSPINVPQYHLDLSRKVMKMERLLVKKGATMDSVATFVLIGTSKWPWGSVATFRDSVYFD